MDIQTKYLNIWTYSENKGLYALQPKTPNTFQALNQLTHRYSADTHFHEGEEPYFLLTKGDILSHLKTIDSSHKSLAKILRRIFIYT